MGVGERVQVVFNEKGGVPGVDLGVEAGLILESMSEGIGMVAHGSVSSGRSCGRQPALAIADAIK
jgi:hypothetical protein